MSHHVCPSTGVACFEPATYLITERGPDGAWTSGRFCEQCAKQYLTLIEVAKKRKADASAERVDFVIETILEQREKLQDGYQEVRVSHGGVLKYLLGLIDFLNSQSPRRRAQRVEKLPCPECGTPFVDIITKNRAGCYFCYQHFKEELVTFNPELYEDPTAPAESPPGGKVKRPNPVPDLRKTTSILILEAEMARAVKREDYERAAQVRDRIRELTPEVEA